MSLVNRCWFDSATSGLADFGVGAPRPGYFTPVQAGAIGGMIYTYAAQSEDLSQVEVGQGIYNSITQTLARTIILLSSAGAGANVKVNFAQPPQVIITEAKEDIGLIRVAGGLITSPVTSFDLTLPLGYFMFEFRYCGLAFGQPEQMLTCAWSADAGQTFLNDIINRDSYVNYVHNSMPPVPVPSFDDLLISASPPLQSGNFGSGMITIDPGRGSGYPSLRGTAVDDLGNFLSWFATANRSAKIPPTTGRMNLLRMLPYGSESVTTPSTGEHTALPGGGTITAASWSLFGIL